MKRRKVLCFGVAAILAVGLLAGCGGSNAEDTADAGAAESDGERVLRLGGHTRMYPGEDEAWEAVAAQFEKENPGVRVEINWQGSFDDVAENIQAAKLAGETIDLYSCGARVIQNSLAPAGICMDMTELIVPYEERFVDGMLESATVGNKIWSIPIGSSGTCSFYYNKTMFDELGLEEPTSFEELVEVCTVIKEQKNITPILQQGSLSGYWPMWFMETYAQTSGNQSVENVQAFLSGERTFDTEEEIEAFNLIKRFFDEGLIDSDSLNTDADGMRAAFSQEKSAIFFGGTWEYTNVEEVVGDSFEIGVFEFPVMVEGVEAQHGGGCGTSLFIPTFCDKDNFDLIMKFVEVVTRPEFAGPIIEAAGPIIPSIQGVEAAGTTEGMTNFIRDINENHAKHIVTYLDWIWPSEINDIVAQAIPAVGTGNITSEEAVAQIQSTYDRLVTEGYQYDWWSSWTDEQWAEVTPATIPESYADQ